MTFDGLVIGESRGVKLNQIADNLAGWLIS